MEVLTSDGFKVTGFPTIFLVGDPSLTVLISTLIGSLPFAGFLEKNKSNAVKNAPLASSFWPLMSGSSIFPPTLKVCANGL